MNTYQGEQLDKKIATFLERKTAKFPELQTSLRKKREYTYAQSFKESLQQYSTLLRHLVHA